MINIVIVRDRLLINMVIVRDKLLIKIVIVIDKHPVLGRVAGDNRRQAEREVILLGDQALPPLLPSSSELNCMRIIRLEFGSLHQLVSIMLDLLEGRRLCPGSLILMFSVTHIAQVGIAGYIEDLVASKKKID